MTSFDEREKAAEAKLAYDEEFRFKVLACRNKYLGLWAAALLGLSGEKAKEYASRVLSAQFLGRGDDAVFQTLRTDFEAAKIAGADHQIRHEMDRLLVEATKELVAGIPMSPKVVEQRISD